jgi:hypothetical protein
MPAHDIRNSDQTTERNLSCHYDMLASLMPVPVQHSDCCVYA